MSMPAASARFSDAKCTWLPTPAEPKFSAPGLALAMAINSFRFFAGEPSGTTTSIGPLATLVIATRSFLVSKGMDL